MKLPVLRIETSLLRCFGSSCILVAIIGFALIGVTRAQDVTERSAENWFDSTEIESTEYQAKASQASYPPAEAYTDTESVPLSMDSQLEDLRTQIAHQQIQISRLRSRQSAKGSARPGGGQLFATYESVLVQPTQSNPTAIIVQTDDGFSHVAFPWKLEHSPRIQFGREASSDSLGWRLRFWELRHTQGLAANAENGLIPTGNEGTAGYFIENGDVLTGLAFINEGTFISKVRTDVIDWELQRQLNGAIDFYGGLRYAKVAQGYAASTDEGVIRGNSDFRGLGPTAALRITHVLPLDKLHLFANVRGSMLFGGKSFSAIDDTDNLRQSFGEINLLSGDDNANALVTNAELQLGLKYLVVNNFSLSVAVEAQHFGNVGGPNPSGVFTGVDGGLTGGDPRDDDLAFLGLTVGASLRW